MRVAIVCDYFLDYIGGAQTSILEQAAILEQAGHEVLLIAAARDAAQAEAAEYRGHRAALIRPGFTLPGLELPVHRNRAALRKRLQRILSDNGIDTVHVQSEFGLAHAAADVAQQTGIALIHTVHTFYWHSEAALQGAYAPLARALLQSLTGASLPRLPLGGTAMASVLRNLTLAMALRVPVVISPSEHQAQDLEAAGVTAPVLRIANPTRLGAGAPPVAVAEQLAAAPRILWVARMEPEKRPLEFVQGVIEAEKTAPGAFAIDLVGSGSLEDAVRAAAAGHPAITVHGALPHERVRELLDAASLLAITSLGFDNQPMTITEAISRHRGVLYCDPKLTEGLGRAGLLTPTPDAAGIAAALTRAVTTEGLLAELSRAAADSAWEFSAERYLERFTEARHLASS